MPKFIGTPDPHPEHGDSLPAGMKGSCTHCNTEFESTSEDAQSAEADSAMEIPSGGQAYDVTKTHFWKLSCTRGTCTGIIKFYP